MHSKRIVKKLRYWLLGPIVAIAVVAVGLLITSGIGLAAPCQPAAGFGSVTRTGVTTPSSGEYVVWVRMQSSDPMHNGVGVEVTPSGGSPNCLVATSTNFTAWEWNNAGRVNATQSGNTIRLVGLAANVKVDRVILVPVSNASCVPSNKRITNTNPVQEPGDNCLAVATVVPTTSTPVPSTPVPTTPPPGPAVDKNPPTAPTKISRSLVLDPARLRYNLELKWAPSVDAEDKGQVARYQIKRNGQIMQSSSTAKFVDPSININTKYNYEIQGFDKAGNGSQISKTSVTAKCFIIWCWLE
ncbi:hypothetical protein IPM44_03240 [bacterium]|nr:MAG: hypothetical protein IPM44_03240 [bacterium]